MTNLLDYAHNVTSQAGEDGIIRHIFQVIGSKNQWCCEFGAWDGKHLSNTWKLINQHQWSSVQIELDEEKFAILEQRYQDRPDVHCLNTAVSKRNGLDQILRQTPIPKDFDLLVIDVDGNDYWLWKWLTDYQPRVVMVEYNSSMPPNVFYLQEYDFQTCIGVSLRALSNLAKNKGYTLAAGLAGNAIFVRDDEYHKLAIQDNSVEALTNTAFTPMLISDLEGYHYLLKVGIYGMTKYEPNNPLHYFSIQNGPPKGTAELRTTESPFTKKTISFIKQHSYQRNKKTEHLQVFYHQFLQQIFRRLGYENRWCCEFNAWDGKLLNQTWKLIETAQWSAVQLEPNAEKHALIAERYAKHPNIHCMHTPTSAQQDIDSLLSQTPIPKDFDLLVLDAYGNDYWLWQRIKAYKPRVVMIGYNSSMPANLHYVQQDNTSLHIGASLRALSKLANQQGYELVAVLAGNAVFVRNDEFHKLGIQDNSVETMLNHDFLPIVISDQSGRHFITRLGMYDVNRSKAKANRYEMKVNCIRPKGTAEIFIEEDDDAQKIVSIMKRGWEEKDSSTITPVRLYTFEEMRETVS